MEVGPEEKEAESEENTTERKIKKVVGKKTASVLPKTNGRERREKKTTQMTDEDQMVEEQQKEEEEEQDEEEVVDGEEKKSLKKSRGRGRPKKEENENEEKVSKTVKKQKQSAKKSVATKDAELDENAENSEEDKKNKKKKKPAKKAKLPPVYKKGKFNPDVQEIDKTPQLEDPSDDIIDYKSPKSNNRNIIRAAYTKNHTLLQKIFSSGKLTTFFDVWGQENDLSAPLLIFKNKDKEGLGIFLSNYQNKNVVRLAQTPPCYLREIDTGYNSVYTFGVKVRKVKMARGGREGNNAFVGDLKEPSSFDDELWDKVAIMNDVDPQMIDMVQAKFGK